MVFDLTSRRLYLCTPLRDDLTEFVRQVIRGGVDVVQLREKQADIAAVAIAARKLVAVCNDLDVPFILNDRPETAYDVGADGVHVGQDDASIDECRKILGPDAIVGLSTHSPSDLADAITQEINYLSAGPIEATPTKPGRAGVGPQYVARAVASSLRPVFVTGGVTPKKVSGLAALGVTHFVVVRYLTDSPRPFEAAQQLRKAIEDALHLGTSFDSGIPLPQQLEIES